MHFETERKWMADIAGALSAYLLQFDPADAQAILGGGLIANIIGRLPEEFWQAMMKESSLPCGQPDCGCETVRAPLFAALDKQRTDWREQIVG